MKNDYARYYAKRISKISFYSYKKKKIRKENGEGDTKKKEKKKPGQDKKRIPKYFSFSHCKLFLSSQREKNVLEKSNISLERC